MAELFEAKQNSAIIFENDGKVLFGKEERKTKNFNPT